MRREFRILPNILTLINAFFGFWSIVLAAQNKLIPAALLIFVSALFDFLDGRIARFAGTTSELGMQLDSLSDAISFSLAPAMLVYHWQLYRANFLGLVIAGIFLACGLFRLARFNLTHTEQRIFFLGLPTTLAGIFLATFVLSCNYMIIPFFMLPLIGLLVIALAFFMVSTIRFPTLKQ